jgi:pimeloyl-ACP methyl ester carboxylesterase
MLRLLHTAVIVAAFLSFALPVRAQEKPSPALGLHVKPCKVGSSKASAECGTFGVYENRVTKSGRIIQLRVVVLKAKRPSVKAIGWIDGGPGESAVSDADYIADGYDKVVAALRDRYDVLFVDNRGMGGSNPSNCDIAPRSDPAAYFSQIWPDKIIAACRRRISSTSDPNFYNTYDAVDDLNDVRAALGYPKLVLIGGSYGTYFSLVYMRQHPDSVQSAVLIATTAPHFQPLPGSPDGAQNAVDDLAKKCGLNPSCARHFPHFLDEFDALVKRFDAGPIQVTFTNPKTKQTSAVMLSKEVFVDRMREALYAPEIAAYIPFAIHSAYRYDYVPLGKVVDLWSQILTLAQDAGANLSYNCAEWTPFVSEKQLAFAAAHSFAGDLRVRAQQHACSIWNVRAMPPSFNDPVRSDAPVLVISGTDDPATPPRYAEEALRYLPNGKEVLVRGAGHGAETKCVGFLLVQFVREGTAKGLDVSDCSDSFKLPPSATSMAGFPN